MTSSVLHSSWSVDKRAAFCAALALMCSMAVNRAYGAGLPDFERLVGEHSASVVSIQTRAAAHAETARLDPDSVPGLPEFLRRFRNFRMPPQMQPAPRGEGLGSGVVASADGFILTNAHVVAGAEEIVVQLSDRREFPARLVGADPYTDVAVLKIDADNLKAATFGDSDRLNVGQWVLAIGAPFGLDQTATQGIVSAVSRSLPNDTYVPFIQTDVALNPGNSGGPLFNLDGEVVGLNSQIFSRTGGYMGLSFAVPINLVANIAGQLKANGQISRGWLGISIQDLDQTLAESFGLTNPQGALVSAVAPESPAARAGLRPGDIILDYNGKPIARSASLPPLVADTPAGADSVVSVWRESRRRDITITVGLLPNAEPVAAAEVPAGALGLVVSDLTREDRAANGVAHGVHVDRVLPGEPADRAGLAADDIIVAFANEDVDNVAELAELSRNTRPGAAVPVLVQRDRQIRFLALKVPERRAG